MDDVHYYNETYQEVHDELTFHRYALIISGIICIIPGFVIDLFIIYAIKFYTELRTKRNLFVLNLCISDALYQMIIIMQYLCAYICSYTTGLCIVYTLDVIIEILNFIIIIGFFIDFIYNRITGKIFKFITIIIWSITLIYSLIESILCSLNFYSYYYYYLSFVLHIFLYAIFLIKSIYLLIICKIKKKEWNDDDKFRYILTSIFVFYQVIHSFIVNIYYYDLELMLYYIEHTQMIVFFLILIKYDNNFKLCFQNTIKCKYTKDVMVKYNNFEEIEINN